MTQEFKIEKITGPLGCGEGPHWDVDRKVLYLVDIPKALVLKYDPATKKLNQAKVDAPFVSFILPVKGTSDKFVVGLGRDLAIIRWDGVSTKVPKSDIEVLFQVEPDRPNNRFNDGKSDPVGRVFAGTMGGEIDGVPEQKRGALYRFGKERKLKTLATEIGIANGLAWTEDNKTLYYNDSLTFTVDAFDYDINTGDISNRRVVFDLKKNNIEGIADGMTIDRDGNLWVALYMGNQVIHIDPRKGKLLRKLPIPGRDITSVAFIGDNLDQLVVTSAYKDLPPGETTVNPLSGSTYIVHGLGAKGYVGIPADRKSVV